jgi:hypothetical protein
MLALPVTKYRDIVGLKYQAIMPLLHSTLLR